MDERQNNRVMLVGHFGAGALECSYRTAFETLGCEARCFDIADAVERYCRFGSAGRVFNQFVPVEAWIRKANREMVMQAIQARSDLVVTFGHYPIQAGALAQIRLSLNAYVIHIWPDTLMNLEAHVLSCLPIYDLIATYARSTVQLFQSLGAAQVAWIPLAGDPLMHPVTECAKAERIAFGADVTFIGGWRPEREAVLSELGAFHLKIWGPDWGRRCRGNHVIMRAWQGRPIHGREFAKAVSSSKINLNIIDPTNYPAANMRFFEIPTAGGLQISSPCPEMEDEFRHGEHVFYYRHTDELPTLIQFLLANDGLREKVAAEAHAKTLGNHTYVHRARCILEQCGHAPR